MGVFKLNDEKLKERLFEGLVEFYGVDILNPGYVIIGALCDGYLDRSGALLGEVRKASYKLKYGKEL